MNYYVYDLETYLHCFLFCGKFRGQDEYQTFEISRRRNDRDALLTHLSYLQNCEALMVGYNNIGFDYPIIDHLLKEPYTFDALRGYNLGQEIIKSQGYGFNRIRPSDRLIPQLDLVKLNHFDNRAKRTRLKDLEFAMRMDSIEDLPYPVDAELTSEQMDELIKYCHYDIEATEKFLVKCIPLIDMRQDLITSGTLSGDVLNWSDVKLGTEYLARKIGRAKCYTGSKPKQTLRTHIAFNNIILPKIKFRTEKFQAVKDWFTNQEIYIEAPQRPKLQTELGGLDFHFGVGGVHASVEGKKYESNDTHVIKDIDVAGMYVAVAIANGFHPEHLGEDFITAYKQLQRDRAQYPKGTTMNAVLKLAGNGVYGNSNNPYSCFYDPKYTFSVTVNGQLQLLQLAESLSLIPGLELIQANTDGVTVYMPRNVESFFDMWCREWEKETGLVLEEIIYDKMWIRDVNNYFVLTADGKTKAKGAYWYPKNEKEYEGWWNKDFSMMCVQKGVEAYMLNGWQPEDTLKAMSNPFDFMKRYKATGTSQLFIADTKQQKTCRYYVTKDGEPMKKAAEPKGKIGAFKRKNKLTDTFFAKTLSEIPEGAWDERIHTKNKSTYQTVTTGIEAGKLVKECNVAEKFNWKSVDYDYYAAEIKKLLIGE